MNIIKNRVVFYVISGIFVGGLFFLEKKDGRTVFDPAVPARRFAFVHKVLWNKYYFDELYALIIKYVQGTIAAVCELFDRWILQRLGIGGLSVGTGLLGKTTRQLQTGSISGYAFLIGLGVTVVIYCVVVR